MAFLNRRRIPKSADLWFLMDAGVEASIHDMTLFE